MTLAIETLPSIYSQFAPAGQVERTAQALERNGIHTLIVDTGEEARQLFLELVPAGMQVHQGSSVTLEQTGITYEIEKSGRFEAVRPRIRSLDRATQAHEIRQLSASPDYMVGSVQAVTEDGKVLVASGSGSQLGPYVSGARQVIWVVGAQKLVKNLDEAFQRLEDYVLPLEDQRARQSYGMGSNPNKILIFNRERPGRLTMILVRETIGF